MKRHYLCQLLVIALWPLVSLHAAIAQADYSQLNLAKAIANGAPAQSLQFSPTGRTLAAAVERRITLYSTDDWIAQDLPVSNGNVTALAFSRDGLFLASGCDGDSPNVAIYDMASKTLVQSVATAEPISCLLFSPDSNLLAIGTHAPGVQVYNIADKVMNLDLRGPPYAARSLYWQADGKALRCASGDADLNGPVTTPDENEPDTRIYTTNANYIEWAIPSGVVLRQQTIEGGGPDCVFSPDGKSIATVGSGLLATATAAVAPAAVDPDTPTDNTDADPDAAAGTEQQVLVDSIHWGGDWLRVWQVPVDNDDFGKFIVDAPLEAPVEQYGHPSIAWSPDGENITFGDEQTQYIWRIANDDDPKLSLHETSQGLLATAFSPDGLTLVGSDQSTLYVWKVVEPPIEAPSDEDLTPAGEAE